MSKDPETVESVSISTDVLRYLAAGQRVNAVTHDINNYLGAIVAYSDLVRTEETLSDDARRMLHEIARIVQKSSGLLEALTSVVRPQSKGITLCDLKEFAGYAVELFVYDLKVRQIKHELKVDDEAATLAGDQGKLMRALLYLLANAMEQAELETVKMIRVRVYSDDDAVYVEVKNSGRPIPEAERERIFEPGHSTKPGAHPGLGLSEARAAARFHRGDLTYDPERGFVMRLPKENEFAL